MNQQTRFASKSEFPLIAKSVHSWFHTGETWDTISADSSPERTRPVNVGRQNLFRVENAVFQTQTQILKGEFDTRTTWIRSLDDERLVLRGFIPVTLLLSPDAVTASWDELNHFGVGEDEISALADLKATIVDAYFLLQQNKERLGPEPSRQWSLLQSVIEEK